ncbi:hypothetical protein [Flavobacterium sp. XS2P14]|uniref:hypothetical protein n=1 Tax=Flavobacterium sp. XS2P14 TaxID=3401735 RepID=UPI003AAEFC91
MSIYNDKNRKPLKKSGFCLLQPRYRTYPFVWTHLIKQIFYIYNKMKKGVSMSRNYKFHNPEGLYVISFAVVRWLDVFTRNEYKDPDRSEMH